MTSQEPTKGLSGGFFHAGVNTTWAKCSHKIGSTINVRIDWVSLETFDQHLDYFLKSFTCLVSDQNDGCAAFKGTVTVDSHTDRRSGSLL